MLQTRQFKSNVDLARQVGALEPTLKAYVLGYLTSTIPRLLSLIRELQQSDLTLLRKLDLLKKVLIGSVGLNRFPTSCAIIVAGSTILSDFLKRLLAEFRQATPSPSTKHVISKVIRQTTLITTFASAWVAFGLLNRDEAWSRKRAISRAAEAEARPMFFESPNQHHLPPPGYHTSYAGKTIDFTLFALCRAIDAAVVTTWYKTRSSRWHPEKLSPKLALLAQKLTDPWVFSTSSAIIMWAWFYAPARLPKAYNRWISKVANIDHRLIEALRLCRRGDIVYGHNTGYDAELPSLCKELHLSEELGDPSVTVPIPCELYHCGTGRSCEVHAITRFLKTFSLAIRLYLPLQIFSIFRRFELSGKRLAHLLKDAARSSSFLAAFVGLFYYAVCLARTRLGPRVFSQDLIKPQMWDSGLCVLAGCLACGWSILLEKPGRQQEIASFVAPRALATILPRIYDKQYQKREQLAFAASTAVVLNAVRSRNHYVRGALGKLLEGVLN
ncbi:hypothetical protein H2198_002769 [Neophaeococcomyces mojaviensis]|uniref:Uncharacterized protein n=1 Tax=Neophaeococcomyces mojaviensis TaxID=3383035 RepID=A0ACC3ADM5_9EURO|nr:hypothetical protein H2198_002769 [Knufia sp. JES_112]